MPSDKEVSSPSAATEEAEPVVRGSETAPFLYVDNFWDASWGEGVAKFRLVRFRRRDEPNEEGLWEVVAVLAISAKNLAVTHRFIGDILERMKETGDYVEENFGEGE